MKATQESPLREQYGKNEGGVLTHALEQQRVVPTDAFLWAAGGSILGALLLALTGRKHASLFVGQWAPTLLLVALYHKLVKSVGSAE